MKLYVPILLLLTLVFNSCEKKDINVLLITSDRKVPDVTFFEMFNGFENIQYTNSNQPEANEWIENGNAHEYDLLVFYDLNDSITPSQKEAYIQLLEDGKPMLFLHHTLVSYQEWPEFTKIIGGKYNREDSISGPSTFEHDVEIPVNIADKNHPITMGLVDFTILDETYDNCFISDGIHPLLTTDLNNSMHVLAWMNHYQSSTIVYIQSGHDDSAFRNPHYQQLIKQSVNYLAGLN